MKKMFSILFLNFSHCIICWMSWCHASCCRCWPCWCSVCRLTLERKSRSASLFCSLSLSSCWWSLTTCLRLQTTHQSWVCIFVQFVESTSGQEGKAGFSVLCKWHTPKWLEWWQWGKLTLVLQQKQVWFVFSCVSDWSHGSVHVFSGGDRHGSGSASPGGIYACSRMAEILPAPSAQVTQSRREHASGETSQKQLGESAGRHWLKHGERRWQNCREYSVWSTLQHPTGTEEAEQTREFSAEWVEDSCKETRQSFLLRFPCHDPVVEYHSSWLVRKQRLN